MKGASELQWKGEIEAIHTKRRHTLALLGTSVAILAALAGTVAMGQRQPPPIPPEVLLKDFDVWVPSRDPNGFPINPLWGKQVRESPEKLPTPKGTCPAYANSVTDYTSSQFPNCTSEKVWFNMGDFCGPHANFMTVRYEGTVFFDGQPWFWPRTDDDYTFNMTRPDSALYTTAGEQVHVEFDKGETVDNYTKGDTWWQEFNAIFHYGYENIGVGWRHQMIDGRFAIVIGLLGLDTEHDAKTELHPVYAMFVLTGTTQRGRGGRAATSTWAFFVRNWGNEGYCSDYQEWLPPRYEQISVPIPHASQVLSTNMWGGARNASDDDLSHMSVTAEPSEAGTVLNFQLLPAGQSSWIEGDITFAQQLLPGDGTLARTPSRPRLRHDRFEETVPPHFEALVAAIEKLPPTARGELVAQQQAQVPTKPGKRLALRESSTPAATVENRGRSAELPHPEKDDLGASIRRKKTEVAVTFLRKRGIQIDLP